MKVNISKFKLIDGGYKGIVIESIEAIPFKNGMIMDKVKRERDVTISMELRNRIQNLKYFYLNLTSHWIPPYNKFFDLQKYEPVKVDETQEMPSAQKLMFDIWNHTSINGVTVKDNGFCIIGEIEVVELKKIGIATPFITEEDDVSFYTEAMQRISDIMNDISFNLEKNILPIYNDVDALKALNPKVEDTANMTKEEVYKELVDYFSDKGAIVLVNDTKEIKQEDSNTVLHTGTGNIDSSNMPEAEVEEKVVKPVKKPKNSTLASEKDFPDLSGDVPVIKQTKTETVPEGGTIEDLEYSQNLGMQQDIEPEPEPEPDERTEW